MPVQCATVREVQQNACRDAKAIAEAGERENMRFVSITTESA